MKNLGLLLALLVSAPLAVADISNQAPVPEKLQLAMSEQLIVAQPKIKASEETQELDTNAILTQANARLEQAMEDKLDALLSAKLEALNEQ